VNAGKSYSDRNPACILRKIIDVIDHGIISGGAEAGDFSTEGLMPARFLAKILANFDFYVKLGLYERQLLRRIL